MCLNISTTKKALPDAYIECILYIVKRINYPMYITLSIEHQFLCHPEKNFFFLSEINYSVTCNKISTIFLIMPELIVTQILSTVQKKAPYVYIIIILIYIIHHIVCIILS